MLELLLALALGLTLVAVIGEALLGELGQSGRLARLLRERRVSQRALELGPWGWRGAAAMGAVACDGADTSLDEGLSHGELVLAHTFPGPVRFAVHGLAIDGGTAVVGAPGTDLVRCLVMSQPLGVVRVGRYRGAITASPKAADCLPDPAL